MKAIKVSYLTGTSTRESRYKATIADGQGVISSITESFSYKLSRDEQPLKLAEKLIKKIGWDVEVSGIGSYKDDYFITIK